MIYTHSHREEFVFNLLDQIGINNYRDMSEEEVAYQLGIFINKTNKASHCQQSGRFRAIYLNIDLDPKQRRLEFFHELGHLLRSIPGAHLLPTALKDFMEWDAQHFEFYAAMPYKMMDEFDLNDPQVVYHLSDSFCVPESYVIKKLQFIREKQAQYQLLTK
ncbi:hypothetical protein FLK61_35345 [Paenalkalicoccus suaedae]|uniref:IrrE N-terminal-like domain-containing protein n=1 Tax=Paenalkalicoccus suaedae TaxID=2592382 RepID=A0A859FI96_9BACI|nr:ImmA/IrrE family metallo-endopeptidase [Paenalkalicoccus suaedae]QKS71945.1 hypothetical protein FLK61_35345 [Paenalkalicoccus suaedae]